MSLCNTHLCALISRGTKIKVFFPYEAINSSLCWSNYAQYQSMLCEDAQGCIETLPLL